MMHIGELAEKAGTTTRTVRYYEEMGLVTPEGRTPGGFRRYTEAQYVRLRMVLSLREMGFELESIGDILERRHHSQTGGGFASVIVDDLHERLQEVNAEVSRLSRMREKIRQSIDSLGRCSPCERQLAERVCPECHDREERGEMLPFFHLMAENNGSGRSEGPAGREA